MNTNSLPGALAVAAVGAGLLLISCHKKTKPIDSAALLQALEAAKQPAAAADSVKKAAVDGDACHYAEVASRAALDADLHEMTQSILKVAPPDCQRAAILQGERAEALARAGSKDEAEQAAKDALKAEAPNAYAQLALSRISYDQNQMTSCADYADKALRAGRGAEAERLLGRSTLARDLFKESEEHYQNVLKWNPNDAEAAFSAGVCDDKLGHYRQAREAFLQTLRIDPKHIEARTYLVVLTFRAGAKEEARHHLDKLEQVAGRDSPGIIELEQLLSETAADAGASADAGEPK